jgi:hypothetical protein
VKKKPPPSEAALAVAIAERRDARALLFAAAERTGGISSHAAPVVTAELWASRALASQVPLDASLLTKALTAPQRRKGQFTPLSERVVDLLRAQLARAVAVGNVGSLKSAIAAADGESRECRRALAREIANANAVLADVLRNEEASLVEMESKRGSPYAGSPYAGSPREGRQSQGTAEADELASALTMQASTHAESAAALTAADATISVYQDQITSGVKQIEELRDELMEVRHGRIVDDRRAARALAALELERAEVADALARKTMDEYDVLSALSKKTREHVELAELHESVSERQMASFGVISGLRKNVSELDDEVELTATKLQNSSRLLVNTKAKAAMDLEKAAAHAQALEEAADAEKAKLRSNAEAELSELRAQLGAAQEEKEKETLQRAEAERELAVKIQAIERLEKDLAEAILMGSSGKTKLKVLSAGTPTGKKGQWNGAGNKLGMGVWRVEVDEDEDTPDAEAVIHIHTVKKKEQGLFNDGDSYLVLTTDFGPDGKAFEYTLYLWIGPESELNERKVAAAKAYDLEKYLLRDNEKGHSLQLNRVVGTREPKDFLALWRPGQYRIVSGGANASFNPSDADAWVPLLMVLAGPKKERELRHIPKAANAMNQGGVYVLNSGFTIYLWRGAEATAADGRQAAEMLRPLTKMQNARLENVQGEAVAMGAACADVMNVEFFNLIDGEAHQVAPAPDDEDAPDEKAKMYSLYQISDERTGELEVEPVQQDASMLSEEGLDGDDAFLIDLRTEIILWVGDGATEQENEGALAFAEVRSVARLFRIIAASRCSRRSPQIVAHLPSPLPHLSTLRPLRPRRTTSIAEASAVSRRTSRASCPLRASGSPTGGRGR